MIEYNLTCLEDVQYVVKNQWLQLFERNFVVIITQQERKENTQTYNGLLFLMARELRPAPNALKQ